MKKIVPILLIALIITLSACSDATMKQYVSSNNEKSEDLYDYTASSDFMDADKLIMTVGDSPVYWDEYYYWMSVAVKNLVYDNGEITDWSDIYSASYDIYGYELDYNEFVRYYAYDAILMYRTIEKKFDQEGLSLQDGDVYTTEEYMSDNDIQSEAELEAALVENCMTVELFEYIETVSAKYYALLESVYGIQGADCPDEEVLVYAENHGYMQVKHILISSEESKEQAESILSELQSINLTGEELEAAFDEKMMEYSEDTGLTLYPDGYLFKSGDMDEEFEAAAKVLQEYEISQVVKSDSGYHIILRLPINCDAVPYGGTDPLRYLTAYERFDSIVSGWQKEMTITYEDAFDEIVAGDIFVNMN